MSTLRHEVQKALGDPWFHVCLMESIDTPELVKEFDRLYGTSLIKSATPIELMIDNATGKSNDDMRQFVEFVYDFIYTRVECGNPELLKRACEEQWRK